MTTRRSTLLLGLLPSWADLGTLAAQPLPTIAAAADLEHALEEVATRFERRGFAMPVEQ